jgi:hypothetical protein
MVAVPSATQVIVKIEPDTDAVAIDEAELVAVYDPDPPVIVICFVGLVSETVAVSDESPRGVVVVVAFEVIDAPLTISPTCACSVTVSPLRTLGYVRVIMPLDEKVNESSTPLVVTLQYRPA